MARRLFTWLFKTMALSTTAFLTSFDPSPLVPADGTIQALLRPPPQVDLTGTSPLLPPRQALWGNFYPEWAPDVRPRRLEEGLDLEVLASDPQNRVEADFRIPADYRATALFWASVFAEYTSQMKVLHDRNDPALVYGYLDFTPLYREHGYFVGAILAEKLEARALTKLTLALQHANGKHVRPVMSAADEQRFRAFLVAHGYGTKKALRGLPARLRSQTGQADAFQSALDRSQELMTTIEQIFERHGLPRALARIPFIESSFNRRARSKVGARGIWQILPRTARALLDPEDESAWDDPIRQADAAARLLRNYRRHLPNWETAVTSYNAGIGRVSHLLHARAGKAPFRLLLSSEEATRHGVGFASRNYYPELLAANLVDAYRDEIFDPGELAWRRAKLTREMEELLYGKCWNPVLEEDPPPASRGTPVTLASYLSGNRLDLMALLNRVKEKLDAELASRP